MKRKETICRIINPTRACQFEPFSFTSLSLTTNQFRKPKRLTKATKCKCLLEAFWVMLSFGDVCSASHFTLLEAAQTEKKKKIKQHLVKIYQNTEEFL